MASENEEPASENRQHAHALKSKLENLLPPSMRHDRPLQATPRTEWSMKDSFYLEPHHQGVHSPQSPEHEDTHPSTPAHEEETFAPLSNWAHLSFIKNQRNHLQTELKAQQVAGAAARASVAALRRLAFRLAINISVKEKQIADTAKNLASTRKHDYVAFRKAEGKIKKLKQSLKEEERRNQEILQTLERANKLTLQYTTPSQPKLGSTSTPLTPPSSPPSRLATFESPQPFTPANQRAHRHAPSPLNTSRLGDNSDDRIIQAKRESERALAACRDRIGSLQTDCLRSTESMRFLEMTRSALEGEMKDHQSRIASLERARNGLEETVRLTQAQLQQSIASKKEMKAELQSRDDELSRLRKIGEKRVEQISGLELEKEELAGQVNKYTGRVADLESNTAKLEEKRESLESQLENAERTEAELRHQMSMKEHDHATTEKLYKQSQADHDALKQTVAFFESQVQEYTEKVNSLNGKVSFLDAGLKTSKELKEKAEEELKSAKFSAARRESESRSAKDECSSLKSELERIEKARLGLAHDLDLTKEDSKQKDRALSEVRSELAALHTSNKTLEDKLEAARIESLEAAKRETVLRSLVQTLRSQLKTAETSSSDLEGELRTTRDTLSSTKSELATLQEALKSSIESNNALRKELDTSQASVHALHLSFQETNSKLDERERSNAELEEKLSDVQRSKDELQTQLQTTSDRLKASDTSRSSLLTELDEVRNLLSKLQNSLDLSQQEIKQLEQSGTQSQEELQETQRIKAELEDGLRSSKDELSAMEAALASLQAELRESEDSRSELEDKIRQLEDSKAKAEGQIEVLRQSHAESSDKLHKEIQAHVDKSASLESAIASLQDELGASGESNVKLEEELRRVHKEKAAVEEHLHSLQQSSAASSEERQADIQAHKKQITLLETSMEALQDRLHGADESNIASMADLNKLRDEKAGVEERLNVLSRQHDDLALKLQSDTEAHKEGISSLEESITKLRSELQQTKQSHEEELEQVHEASRRALDETKSGHEQRLAALTSELTQMHNERVEVEDRLRDLSSSHSDLSSQLQKEMHDHTAKISGLDETIAKLQDEMEQLKFSHEQELQQVSERHDATSDEARSEYEGRLAALTTELGQTHSEKVDVERRLEESTNASNSLSSRLKSEAHRNKEKVSLLDAHIAKLDRGLEVLKQSHEEELKQAESHHRKALDDMRTVHGQQLQGKDNELKAVEDQSFKADEGFRKLQNELDQLRHSHEQEVRQAGEQHNGALVELQADYERQLQDKINDVQAAEDRASRSYQDFWELRKSKQELERALTVAKDENKSIQNKLRAGEGSVAQLQTDLEAAEERITKSQEESQDLLRSKEEIAAKLANAQKEKEGLQNQLHDAEEVVTQLRSDLERSQEESQDVSRAKEETEARLFNAKKEKEAIQIELRDAEGSVSQLQNDLDAAEERIAWSQEESQNISRAKEETEAHLADLQNQKQALQNQLNEAEVLITQLRSDLKSAEDRAADSRIESHAHLRSKDETEGVLSEVREAHATIENKLRDTQQSVTKLQSDLKAAEDRATISQDESQKLTHSKAELESLLEKIQLLNDTLDNRLKDADVSITKLRTDLLAAEARANKSDEDSQEHLRSRTDAEEFLANIRKENGTLEDKLRYTGVELDKERDRSSNLESHQHDLTGRLATAEAELQAARDSNAKLESFLERIEQDMLGAEAALEESETRLKVFVAESDAKVQAAENGRLKYKRQLSAKGKELMGVKDDHAALQHRLEEQGHELDQLKQSKERLRAEVIGKDHTIAVLQRIKSEFVASVRELHGELKTLREDKDTFRNVIRSLQEKTRHLEVLSEWKHKEPVSVETFATARSQAQSPATGEDVPATPSPAIRETTSPRPSTRSGFSFHASFRRQDSETSAHVEDGTLESWAKEVERIRMQRDDAVVQLKGLKKSERELSRVLREREQQLLRMEKQAKPKRTPTRLQKRNSHAPGPSLFIHDNDEHSKRPATAGAALQRAASPSTSPSRPLTTQTASPDHRPSPFTSLPRPHTSTSRPHTPFARLVSFRHHHDSARPTTKGTDTSKDSAEKAEAQADAKRSKGRVAGLKRLFSYNHGFGGKEKTGRPSTAGP